MKKDRNEMRKQSIGVFLWLCAFFLVSVYGESQVEKHREQEAVLDSIEANMPELKKKVLSTLMFGGSSPVSFSGDARVQVRFNRLTEYPSIFAGDRKYVQAGWDEAMYRLGMIVRPGRNTVLYTKIGFPHTFSGNKVFDEDGELNNEGHGDSKKWAANVFEDMGAGIALRFGKASFMLNLGNIQWVESSPLTIWKGQPRGFAWDHMPYEIEQPIARYFEYAMAKGKKGGRAAWHKKPFNGINLETVSLPYDFKFNGMWATFSEYDKFERESFDLAVDLGLAAADDKKILEAGIGDSYRNLLHLRASKLVNREHEFGLNFDKIFINDDIVYATLYYDNTSNANLFQNMFLIRDPSENWKTIINKGFIKHPMVISADGKGKIGKKLEYHLDIGFSNVDTVWYQYKRNKNDSLVRDEKGHAIQDSIFEDATFDPKFAVIGMVKYDSPVEIQADFAYIGKGFYSPFSSSVALDGMFPFGANLLTEGKFVGGTENSPYTQNLAGIQLTVQPKLKGYGHVAVKYGQHFQLDAGRDLLFMPFRLNGLGLHSVLLSTYRRWGSGLYLPTDGSGNSIPVARRMGDESFRLTDTDFDTHMEMGPEIGGIRVDNHGVFQSVVPYDDPKMAILNYLSGFDATLAPGYHGSMVSRDRKVIALDDYYYYKNKGIIVKKELISDDGKQIVVTGSPDTSLVIEVDEKPERILKEGQEYEDSNGFVPTSKKFTFNFEIDAAYDLGSLIGYDHDFFVGGYLGINGISSKFKPLAFGGSGEDMKMWSLYFRFEPAIALTNKLYMLGLFGYENWQVKNTWVIGGMTNPDGVEQYFAPLYRTDINYKDFTFGLGFNWDVFERITLSSRYQYMIHQDNEYDDLGIHPRADLNEILMPKSTRSYKGHIMSLEIKAHF